MWDSPNCHVGVLRIVLALPGARSLKDRRRVVVSLRDRARKRFQVSCNELAGFDAPNRACLVFTTAGSDADVLQSTLDSVRSFVISGGDFVVASTDLQVLVVSEDASPWLP